MCCCFPISSSNSQCPDASSRKIRRTSSDQFHAPLNPAFCAFQLDTRCGHEDSLTRHRRESPKGYIFTTNVPVVMCRKRTAYLRKRSTDDVSEENCVPLIFSFENAQNVIQCPVVDIRYTTPLNELLETKSCRIQTQFFHSPQQFFPLLIVLGCIHANH